MKPTSDLFLKDKFNEYWTETSGDGRFSPNTSINKYVTFGKL